MRLEAEIIHSYSVHYWAASLVVHHTIGQVCLGHSFIRGTGFPRDVLGAFRSELSESQLVALARLQYAMMNHTRSKYNFCNWPGCFNTGQKPEPVFMESILVAFLRQLEVQDELRRSLDSGLFFTGRVPPRISQLGLKYSNITLKQSLVGKKKFPWKVAFGIEDIHVFATPPSPIGGIWTNGRKFAEYSPPMANDMNSPRDLTPISSYLLEKMPIFGQAPPFEFSFLLYYTTAKDEDHCLRSRREMTQQNNWRPLETWSCE